MKDLVKYLAQALVDSPDEVSVSEIEGEQTSVPPGKLYTSYLPGRR